MDNTVTVTKTKVKNTAKNMTNIMICVAFIVGVIGSFMKTIFDMDAYVKFLGAFAPFVIALIVSIGGNSALSKYKGTTNESTTT